MDEHKYEVSSEDILFLNSLIRDLAVRGHMDDTYQYSGDTEVKWKIIGPYVAVYLETCYYTYGFRLFACQGEAFFSLKQVMESSYYESDEYHCLYDYCIDIDGIGTIRSFAEEDWFDEFMKTALEFLE